MKLAQWEQKIEYEVDNDSLKIKFNNPLHCPLRISAKSSDSIIQEKLAKHFPVTMDAQKDTLFTYDTNKPKDEISLKFWATLGNPNDSINKKDIQLPFKMDHKYSIIQGYNGRYSHMTNYAKYALDFNLKEGDTICAAADGFVVGVIEDYTRGGSSKKWRDYANYITVFHPEMNLYTQYVHLMHKGSLVEVGAYLKSGQAIGRSGKTGYTNIEHLHFNVLKPNNSGMQSVQIDFEEGYRGIKLKKGDRVKK
ncbi:MAG: M23 family metallopeptidase [Cellulophaga sp.]|nr:M23 family metallopeptidase [Cellulophaga sp.]